MDDHGLKVLGPAHVKLDSPDPLRLGSVKGIHGIFKYVPIVIIAPMRNNFTMLQALAGRHGLRPAGIEQIQDLANSLFEYMGNFHFFKCIKASALKFKGV